ncbi:MAG: thiamine diphosphokinase [Pseudomonadota bacterium]
MIVYQKKPLTLVGGGELGNNDFRRACKIGQVLVAADGGANAAFKVGQIPDAVIGDLDSISPKILGKIPPDRLHHIEEQDSTDFDKCLRNLDAPLILAIGFTGARLDHQLAALNVLTRYPAQRCILLGAEDAVFLCPPQFSLETGPGTRISLFPMGEVEGTSSGLKWPIDGISFYPDGPIGTSNEATGPMSLTVTKPKMLLILPQSHFEMAAKALIETEPRW